MANAFDFSAITAAPDRGPQLFVLYGPPKIGKTHLVCTIPSLFIIVGEKGLKGIKDPAKHFPREPRNFPELLSAIDAFEAGNAKDASGQRPFKHLALDSLSWIQRMINEAARAAERTENLDADFKSAKGRVDTFWERLFTRLELLRTRTGCHVWALAHGAQKMDSSQEGETWSKWDLDLDKKIAPTWRQQADHLFFLQWAAQKTAKKKGRIQVGQYTGRVIYTRENADHFAGSRSGVPDKIPATWKDLQKALAENTPAPAAKLTTQIAATLPRLEASDRATIEADVAAAKGDARQLSEALSRALGMLTANSDDQPEDDGEQPDGAPPASGTTTVAAEPEQDDDQEEPAAPLDEQEPTADGAPPASGTTTKPADEPAPVSAQKATTIDVGLLDIIAGAKAAADVRSAIDTAIATLSGDELAAVRVAGFRRLLELATTTREVNGITSDVSKLPPAELAQLRDDVSARLKAVKGKAA